MARKMTFDQAADLSLAELCELVYDQCVEIEHLARSTRSLVSIISLRAPEIPEGIPGAPEAPPGV